MSLACDLALVMPMTTNIEIDELYEEYGIVESIINTPEMIVSRCPEYCLKLFSKSDISLGNLNEVRAYVFSLSYGIVQSERVLSMFTSALIKEKKRLKVITDKSWMDYKSATSSQVCAQPCTREFWLTENS